EMSRKGFGCVGIVDGDRRLVGILTDGDLRRHMSETLLSLTVEEVMTPNPKTVAPTITAAAARQSINSSSITPPLVVDDGRPVGIITDGDLRRDMSEKLLALTVDEVMTPNPKTVAPTILAAAALQIINSSSITTLMVVDDGRPVGIVHLHDLLRIGAA